MIRKYTNADCEAVIEAWYAASIIATPFLSDEFLRKERESIRTIWLHKADTWVFDDGRKVVGFISLISDEVGAIFVHPDSQGMGVGRALMDHAASMRDELFLDVFEENTGGRRFYERYGFQFERKRLHRETGHNQLRLSYRPSDDESIIASI